MQTQQMANGHGEADELRDKLDLQGRIVAASDGNPLLDQSNLGLGNYTEEYLWQQVRSYRKGLYAYIAFGNVLTERAIYETKMKLGREGYRRWDDNKNEYKQYVSAAEAEKQRDDESSWNAEQRHGEHIWRRLGTAKEPVTTEQISAVIKKTGVDPGKWLPFYWQMVAGRHDVSRSLEAELLRDILSDVTHVRDDSEGETAKSLLARARS